MASPDQLAASGQELVLSADELRSMFMQRKYTPQDVERLLASHAALKRIVRLYEPID